MSSSANAQPDLLPRAEVGVLFVHGIGQQAKGATLEEGSNALFAAIGSEVPSIAPEDWANNGKYGILKARFGSVDLAGSGPSTATLWVSTFVGGGVAPTKQRWLLAESHWATAFRSSGLRKTLTWIFTESPVLLLSRAVEGAVTAYGAWARWSLWSYWWRIAASWLWVLLVVPASILLIVGLTLTVLLRSLVPFQSLKDLLGRLEVAITAFVGDSYLFTANEVSRSAMATRVAADIDWLAARVERVVVVSHSQGAAVTTLALASRGPVDTLITFGAGISQLDWLREGQTDERTRSDRRKQTFQMWVAWFALALGAPIQIWFLSSSAETTVWSWITLGIQLVALAWLMWQSPQIIAMYGRNGGLYSEHARKRPGRNLAVRWWDIWASADPVPGGPSTAYLYDDVYSFRTFNRGNILTDHSIYYRNRDEFVGRVLLAALQRPTAVGQSSATVEATPPIWGQNELPQLAVADFLIAALPLRSALRQRRGRWLEAWRSGLAFLAIAVMSRWWSQLAEGVGASADWLAGIFPAFAESIHQASEPAMRISLALLVVALGAVVIYGLSLLLWRQWERVERRLVYSSINFGKTYPGAEMRLGRAQLPFLVIAGIAPTLAICAGVAVLLVDSKTVTGWARLWPEDLSPMWALVALFLIAVLVRGWVRRAAVATLGPFWAPVPAPPLMSRIVRDPLTYKPFRYEDTAFEPVVVNLDDALHVGECGAPASPGKWFVADAVQIAGQTYPNGFCCNLKSEHATDCVEFIAPPGARSFTAAAGQTTSDDRASAVVRFAVIDVLTGAVLASKDLRPDSVARFRVSLEKVARIRLHVRLVPVNGVSSPAALAGATWAEPTFC